MSQEPHVRVHVQYAVCEIIGGPLDGMFAEANEAAFPWPHGWYYLRTRHTVTAEWESYEQVWMWDGDPGTYVDSDATLHRIAPKPIYPRPITP